MMVATMSNEDQGMKFNQFGRALALSVILAVPFLSGCETQPAFQVSQPSSLASVPSNPSGRKR